MATVFGSPDALYNAQQQLERLMQGSNSCVTYTMRFKTLAMKVNYDEQALKKMYYDGLNERLKMHYPSACLTLPSFTSS